MLRIACVSALLLTTAACATTEAAKAAPTPDAAPVETGPVVDDTLGRNPLDAPADVAAPPANAERLPVGLWTRVLRRGTGTVHPGTFSVVRVNYTGWTTDGKRFDSSVERGKPAEFSLNGVIPGWKHGVKPMVVGEKRRLWIPEELAYKGTDGPQGLLVFDVELLAIVEP